MKRLFLFIWNNLPISIIVICILFIFIIIFFTNDSAELECMKDMCVIKNKNLFNITISENKFYLKNINNVSFSQRKVCGARSSCKLCSFINFYFKDTTSYTILLPLQINAQPFISEIKAYIKQPITNLSCKIEINNISCSLDNAE